MFAKNLESACKAHFHRQTRELNAVVDAATDAVFALVKGTPEWKDAMKAFVAAENTLTAHMDRGRAIEAIR